MAVDLTARIGTVALPSPVMTASGTAGDGAELARYVDLSAIGAVVVKSLSAEPWAGNPAPRVHETPAGMINSVGLQNPGVEAWLEKDLPVLLDAGARVVASIWGTSVEEYAKAASMLADAPPDVVAVEINLSCPNHHAREQMFAHSTEGTAEVVAACAGAGRPRWAKLSPNVTDLPSIAGAARDAGAEAVTLVNTLMAMALDVETRRSRLGRPGGGLSGPAMHPVAVRAVHDVRSAHPDLPIVGVGGVASAEGAVELLLVGANAIQVGTATFADPRSVERVQQGLRGWCADHGVGTLDELIGAADVA